MYHIDYLQVSFETHPNPCKQAILASVDAFYVAAPIEQDLGMRIVEEVCYLLFEHRLTRTDGGKGISI
jgi:hypothetical protein